MLLLPLLAVAGCKTYKQQPDLVDIRQFQAAAEHGDAWAQFRLGQAYNSRWKYAEANPWFRKAALQGVPDAMYALGVNCLSGAGVPKDPIAAYAWFDVAATQTHLLAANARQNLADRMTRSETDDGDRMATELVAQIPPVKLRYAFIPKTSNQDTTSQAPADKPMKKEAVTPAPEKPTKPTAPAKPAKVSDSATKPANAGENSTANTSGEPPADQPMKKKVKPSASAKPAKQTAPTTTTNSTQKVDELQPIK